MLTALRAYSTALFMNATGVDGAANPELKPPAAFHGAAGYAKTSEGLGQTYYPSLKMLENDMLEYLKAGSQRERSNKHYALTQLIEEKAPYAIGYLHTHLIAKGDKGFVSFALSYDIKLAQIQNVVARLEEEQAAREQNGYPQESPCKDMYDRHRKMERGFQSFICD